MQSRNYRLLALALLVLAVTTQTRAQSIYTPYAFTNFAGLPGTSGTNDGTGSAAQFNRAFGVVVDSDGNVYVADTFNNTIRKITSAGAVTTLAGSAGPSGTNDGTGSAARFYLPVGVAVDTIGNVYVADSGNDTIRKITSVGAVTTLAGSARQQGTNDGPGSAARFNNPTGVAVDTNGNVYVADSDNDTIRQVTPVGTNWVVTTLAGIAKTPGTKDGTGSAARFNLPKGVAVDRANNLYVADYLNKSIRKVTPSGEVTTLAGNAGLSGSDDGTGSAARFNRPYSVAVDLANNLYVADTYNQTIRKITPGGSVTTLAGSAGLSGSDDGTGSAARFGLPSGVAVNSAGNLYVADTYNYRITKGTPVLQFDIGLGLSISNDFFQMRLIGPSGSNVVVEGSADLAAWTPVQTNTLPPFGLDVSMPLGTDQNQFFRARLAP
jgi:ribosomal protein S11